MEGKKKFLIEGEKSKNGTFSTERLLSGCTLLRLPGQWAGNNYINFPSKSFDYLKESFPKEKTNNKNFIQQLQFHPMGTYEY